ncbi:unnamed protein product [Cylindrotheca closterium]|uniref:Uncharacterized protein n=1 Tax=Cylindrotheca closterium TaxID=2856 RepID=A0AAD2G3R5_9STRA|nr:unnamed protein product [Cylindrotheca closterium]
MVSTNNSSANTSRSCDEPTAELNSRITTVDDSLIQLVYYGLTATRSSTAGTDMQPPLPELMLSNNFDFSDDLQDDLSCILGDALRIVREDADDSDLFFPTTTRTVTNDLFLMQRHHDAGAPPPRQ